MKRYVIQSIAIIIFLLLVFPSCKKQFVWSPGSPLPREMVKIGVIHYYEIHSDSVYDYAHYIGIREMQKNIGIEDSQIIHKVNVFSGDPAAIEEAIRDCIAQGANIIIATSWGFMDTCEKLAQ